MHNYKLTIQYDGSKYHGWQIQQNAPTVQQTITTALETLSGEPVSLIGAGRTDTGVHAFGQVANFRCEKEIDIYRFQYSLNSMLPFEIAISEMVEVPEEFHSRFDAVRRIYWYIIAKSKSPFYKNYTYFYHFKLSARQLNEYAAQFVGEKDYQAFAKELPGNGNTNCIVHGAQWRDTGDTLLFRIDANRYLHSMVRLIVGTQLRTIKENRPPEDIATIFRTNSKELVGQSVPAHGLFLVKVKYGNNSQL